MPLVYNVTIQVSPPNWNDAPYRKELQTTMYTVNSIPNICLLGHSGSGKSALAESDVIYPSAEVQAMGSSYTFLPEEISRYIENLFMQVRNS